MGILPVSKDISGRTSEQYSGTSRSSRPSRSPAATDDMHHVQIAIRRKAVGTRLEEPTDSPGLLHDGLKRRQLEIEIDMSLEIRID